MVRRRLSTEADAAATLSAEHGIHYQVAIALPGVRRLISGDQELGQMLTQVLLSNEEFKAGLKK